MRLTTHTTRATQLEAVKVVWVVSRVLRQCGVVWVVGRVLRQPGSTGATAIRAGFGVVGVGRKGCGGCSQGAILLLKEAIVSLRKYHSPDFAVAVTFA